MGQGSTFDDGASHEDRRLRRQRHRQSIGSAGFDGDVATSLCPHEDTADEGAVDEVVDLDFDDAAAKGFDDAVEDVVGQGARWLFVLKATVDGDGFGKSDADGQQQFFGGADEHDGVAAICGHDGGDEHFEKARWRGPSVDHRRRGAGGRQLGDADAADEKQGTQHGDLHRRKQSGSCQCSGLAGSVLVWALLSNGRLKTSAKRVRASRRAAGYDVGVRAFLLLFLCFSAVVHAADVVGVPQRPRVFFAPVVAGAAADPAVVDVIEDRLLTSARRHPQFEVVAARDVQSLLQLEATRQQSGCDDSGVACAAELAGALDAPQLVTGTLGRVGSTWVLSLTRMERGTLTVLARVSRESIGETPEGFLKDIDSLVDDLFGVEAAAGSSLVPVGAGVGGLGVVGVVVGIVAGGQAWSIFETARQDLVDQPDPAAQTKIRDAARNDGEIRNVVAVVGVVGGGVLVVAGVAVVVAGLQGGE